MKSIVLLILIILLTNLSILHTCKDSGLSLVQTPDEDKIRDQYAKMIEAVAANPARYTEKWRPQYHFSPPQGWMNDPNGLVFFNGKYRMCFQHTHPIFGGTSWGNAESTDLVHWRVLPPAILRDELGLIFSGSAAVDWNDASGFFDGKPGLLAMFTYNKSAAVGQVQGLAYSRNGGETWQKYSGNPVINNYGNKIFIDPKLFWFEPTNRWIVFVGGHGKMRIYSSPDAKQWSYESTIEEIGPGGEVADIFQLPVNGDPNNLKWIWSAGGEWFVVGTFDGHKFMPETDRISFAAGPDAYAAQSWSDLPHEDCRRIFIYWMTGYARKRELTGPWCGSLTLPRELNLIKFASGNYRIAQRPVRELEQLREKIYTLGPLTIKPGVTLLPGILTNKMEIVAEFKLGTAKCFGFNILKGGDEQTVIGYETDSMRMFVDRSKSGYVRILDYAKTYYAELLPENNQVRLHIFADVSSIELFGNDGVANMTTMVLPSPNSKAIEIFAEGGVVELSRLDIYEMKSIWGGTSDKKSQPVSGVFADAHPFNTFESKFISNLNCWIPSSDTSWRFVGTGIEGRKGQYVAETKKLNCVMEADITLGEGAVAGLSVRDNGNSSICRKLTLDQAYGTLTFYEQNTYVYTARLGEVKLQLPTDLKFHLKLEAIGTHYRIWLNDNLLLEAEDQPQCMSSAGYPLLFVNKGNAIFQNVIFKEIVR